MRIGALLRAWREKRDLSVRALAPQIGISIATLSRLERGEQIDADTQLKLIFFLFGCENTIPMKQAESLPSEAIKASSQIGTNSADEETP